MTPLYLLGICAISFVLSLALTPLCRDLALHYRLLDYPDSGRKDHQRAVPRIGGVPILVACAISFMLLTIWPDRGVSELRGGLPFVASLMPATCIVFLVGLVDDLRGLRARAKLAGQAIAAAVACLSGVVITHAGNYAVPDWASYAITIIWLVGCSNAFNLIDGLDGLASGLGLIATAAIALVAVLAGNIDLQLAAIPLGGAMLGFLAYNRHPASVFLGDCGSLTIGFLLGCLAIFWADIETSALQASAPLIAFAIPLLDTVLAIGRRFARGFPIFSPDRRHIHHRLLDRGLTRPQVVTVLYCAAGAAALLSVLQSALKWRIAGWAVLLLVGVAIYFGTRTLHYAEFFWATRIARVRYLQRLVNAQCQLTALGSNIEKAQSAEDRWKVICESTRALGFYSASLHVGNTIFVDREKGVEPSACTITIPLYDDGYLHLKPGMDSIAEPVLIASLARVLRDSLALGQMPRQDAVSLRIQTAASEPAQQPGRLWRAAAH